MVIWRRLRVRVHFFPLPATMSPLRVGYGSCPPWWCWEFAYRSFLVREHFSSPLLQFSDKDSGQTFTLVECPSGSSEFEIWILSQATLCIGGTGQLISRIANDEIDVAMWVTWCLGNWIWYLFAFRALTDPLIAGIANGSKAYKLVGSYVSTPLNW